MSVYRGVIIEPGSRAGLNRQQAIHIEPIPFPMPFVKKEVSVDACYPTEHIKDASRSHSRGEAGPISLAQKMLSILQAGLDKEPPHDLQRRAYEVQFHRIHLQGNE